MWGYCAGGQWEVLKHGRCIPSQINKKANTISIHAAHCPSFPSLLCQLHGMHTRVSYLKYRWKHSVSSWHLSSGSTRPELTTFEFHGSLAPFDDFIWYCGYFYCAPSELLLCLMTSLSWLNLRTFFYFVFSLVPVLCTLFVWCSSKLQNFKSLF